jgi:26S proteasome regulatory subunit N1
MSQDKEDQAVTIPVLSKDPPKDEKPKDKLLLPDAVPKDKDAKAADELSEEDQALKSELEMLVERLKASRS